MKNLITINYKIFLMATLLLPCIGTVKAQTNGPLTLSSANTTGSYISNASITLAPGFSSSGTFSAVIQPIDCLPLTTNPTLTRNYIMTTTPRIPGFVGTDQFSGQGTCALAQDIQYYDGLGRPLQTVQSQASPFGNDIVQPFDYDQFGRESVKYLPYVATTSDGSYKTDALTTGAGVLNYYNPAGSSGTQQSNGIVRTTNPYASTGYEPSPLNRVVEQGAPGVTWQMPGTGSANSNGNTVRTVYATNNALALTDTAHSFLVQKYTVTIGANELRTLVLSGTYLPGTLYVTIHRDENWKSGRGGTVEEYKDLEGHLLLKRDYNWAAGVLKVFSTYYVYDDFDDLCFVLTPASGADTALPIQTTLDNLCYQYKYDERNRLSQKHLPGQKAWESIVYNKLDQPVLTQDANQSAPTQNQWTVTKYDVLGRKIISGLWNAGSTIALSTLQSSIYGASQWDTWSGTAYAVSSYPTTLNTTLSISYYNDYSVPNKPSTNVPPSGYSVMTRGLPTVSQVNILGSSNMLWSITYYDDLGRPIQAYQQHNQGGGATLSVNNYDVISSTYNFVNTINTTVRKHWNASNTTSPLLTINNNYLYDHRERKLKTFEQINGSTNVLIAQSDYNEIGQLLTKHLHSETGSAPFLQDVGYTYNERGWMRTAGAAGNLFYMDLRYDTPDAGISKQYNGNISELLYTGNTSGAKTFSYGYDQLSRLMQATSTGNTLNETISYDPMGNITALTRTGVSPATLAYTYLNSGLSDQVASITNSGSAFRTYSYDNNGNAGSDGGSKTLAYNILNLPTTVTSAGTTIATYTYDADGTKIRNTGTDGTWDYVNGVVYNNNTVVFVQTETGRAIPIAGVYHYEHNLTDNLGNIRLSFDKDPNTGLVRALQEDEYYAFGLRSPRQDNSNHNRYLYNGKEVQTDLANQYDYGARFYDPVIARWNTIDPLSEKSRRWSPYNYVENDPIRLTDPDGMAADTGNFRKFSNALINDLNQASNNLNKFLNNFVHDPFSTLDNVSDNITSGKAKDQVVKGVVKNVVKFSTGNNGDKSAVLGTVFGEGMQLGLPEGDIAKGGDIESITNSLRSLATDAKANVTATGLTEGQKGFGTAAHTELKNLVNAKGLKGVSTEQSYLNGALVKYGKEGSSRADIVLSGSGGPISIFDLKTGGATLKTNQVGKYIQNVPGITNASQIIKL